MSVSIDGAGSLIGVDQGLNIVGLTTLTGGIILDDSISHIGDADTKIRFPAADTFTVETAGSERLRITSAGKVKIGNSGGTPDGKLHIDEIGNGDIVAELTSGSPTFTYRNGSGAWFHAGKHPSDDAFIIADGATTTTNERLRITSAGNVGIGTDNPPWPLSVTGTVSGGTVSSGAGVFIGVQDFHSVIQMNTALDTHGSVIDMGYSGQDYKGRIYYDNSSDYMTLHTNSSERLRITSGGHLVVGSGYADFVSGTRGEASSTDPYKLVFQNQYSNAQTDDQLKLYLFNSGNTRQGFGPGPNYDLQYHCSGGAANQARHRFYTDNVLRMEISDVYDGVTKPTQPGFFTRRSTSGDGRAAGAQEWSVTGTGSFNTGSHFNASNGRFTAPVAGRYLFTAAPGYKQTGQNFQFYFRINGTDASEPVRFIDGGDDLTSHSLATGSIIYNLNANDYVDVYIGTIHHVNTTLNFFCGYLMG